MTERKRYYQKELSKRIIVNLRNADYDRWRAAADLRGEPVATMIRRLVEGYIEETESDWEKSITDIIEYQESLKKNGIII